MTRRAVPLIAAALAGGCAQGGGRYPSLAPRPIERVGFAEPARPRPAATADAALDAAVAARAADLDRIAHGFDAAARTADLAAARPGARTVGSDAWLDAQAASARLDDWRGQASALAATVEALGSARAGRLEPPYPPLDALAGRAAAESDREAQAAEALRRRLPAG